MSSSDPACRTTTSDWRVLNGDDVPPERREPHELPPEQPTTPTE